MKSIIVYHDKVLQVKQNEVITLLEHIAFGTRLIVRCLCNLLEQHLRVKRLKLLYMGLV